jgi:copper chaperone CopZ
MFGLSISEKDSNMKYSFKINMISGGHGKKEVEAVISAIDGVERAEVDLGSGDTVVECSEDIGLDVFAAAVEEAGYVFVWDREGK